jgi:acyl-CoA synthetase (AMP-forming)/AMP-acid ligase II
MRQAVAEEHGLQAYAILLLRAGSIPKTSSGKVQRHACRAAYLDQSLLVVGGSPMSLSQPLRCSLTSIV